MKENVVLTVPLVNILILPLMSVNNVINLAQLAKASLTVLLVKKDTTSKVKTA
jgi:hypothetical protein